MNEDEDEDEANEKESIHTLNPLEEKIERLREVRRRISARYGNEPSRLVEYYSELSTKLRGLINTQARQRAQRRCISELSHQTARSH